MMLQCTPEWFAARVGKVTASRSSDVVAELENKKPSRAATTAATR
jgi:hypothetical protein